MPALRTAMIACALLVACTTDFDRFKIGASGLPNGVKAGDGGTEAGAGGADGGAGGTRTPRGAGSGGGAGAGSSAGAGEAGSDAMPPQGGDGAMAGTGGSTECEGTTVYVDADGDSYGDIKTGRPGCEAEGLVTRPGDCADNDEARHPDAEELCDNQFDDDCNTSTNEGCTCTSGMDGPCGESDGEGGILYMGECEVGRQACVEGKWSEICEGARGPTSEVCNGLDDDCDGRYDEGVLLKRWRDGDGDLYGSVPLEDGCPGESDVAYQAGDCNDGNVLSYPGAPESCGRAGQLGDDCNANTVLHCPTHLPPTPAGCPTLANGLATLFGLEIRIWVGARNENTPAPALIFFYGTGGTSSQAANYYPRPADITDLGGILIAPNKTTNAGDSVGGGVWYTGDFAVIDQVVGCALAQLNIDVRRIYASGFSAGGMQAAVMGYQRSGYIAGVMTNSGGLPAPSFAVSQNAGQLPAVVAMHGAMGSDVVIVDFADLARTYTMRVAEDGGFAVDCNHGMGHARAPTEMQQGAWQVLLDHPWGEAPPGYVLPVGAFAEKCRIVTAP